MIDLVTQLRSYQHATNIRMEIRDMAGRAANEIERLLTENESLKLTLIELNANKKLRLG